MHKLFVLASGLCASSHTRHTTKALYFNERPAGQALLTD